MKAFFKPKALLYSTTKLRDIFHSNVSIPHQNYSNSTCAVVVFSHHRDVKVAFDDLDNAGLASDGVTLVAHNARRYFWDCDLIINNYFDSEKFAFNQIAQEFFSRLFQRGKYLALITGDKYDVNTISKIMARRQGHAEAWHFK